MADRLYCTSCKTIKDLMPGPYAKVKGNSYYLCRSCNTARFQKYRKSEKGAENTKRAAAKQRKYAHKKYLARNAVNEAIRAGNIIRPDECPNCDTITTVHAHHPNYDEPLNVRWLCRKCHIALHRTISKTML